MNHLTTNNFKIPEDSVPRILEKGMFGATFYRGETPLFLRLQLLTEENAKAWQLFKETSCWAANLNNGALSELVKLAGTAKYPKYEKVREVTGFTEEEFIGFTEKIIKSKEKTENRIVSMVLMNSSGIDHMYVGYDPEKLHSIAYISKDPNFSIQNTGMENKERTLKNFYTSYKSLVITMGSDLSEENSLYHRGISANVALIIGPKEEKYPHMSMLLHGFVAAVYPKKQWMYVSPLNSMQYLLCKSLLPGEGYLERDGKQIDITDLDVSPGQGENPQNHIKVSALLRIYANAVSAT